MPKHHVVELALDLARMPALAQTSVDPPIPSDISELMRIAAASPDACKEAAEATGESKQVLIDAARFFLQQTLFRSDADSFRMLGIKPGVPRATARHHMRLLLEWLHPDRNHDLDAVYAKRVLRAWREVSSQGEPRHQSQRSPNLKRNSTKAFRLPWIKQPDKSEPYRFRRRVAAWLLPATLIIAILALLWVYYFGADQSLATIPIH